MLVAQPLCVAASLLQPGNCQSCALKRLCLPAGLQQGEIEQLDSIVKRSRPLLKGEYLFRAGEPMQQLYALRAGALKTTLLSPQGSEQITAFHLPGELIGLDALATERHPGYAVALESSQFCTLPLHELEELAGCLPNLRKQLLGLLSRELHLEQAHGSSNRESAEQRLALFLLNLSMRYSSRGLSAVNFILPMNRADLGNYLGLTIETVCRLLARYRRWGLIETRGRELRILDLHKLQRLGEGRSGPEACAGGLPAGSQAHPG